MIKIQPNIQAPETDTFSLRAGFYAIQNSVYTILKNPEKVGGTGYVYKNNAKDYGIHPGDRDDFEFRSHDLRGTRR